jgi:hypothetical protein
MEEVKFRYATDEADIIFKEYGRNIQRIVHHLLTVEDREKRTRQAFITIELMKILNPGVNDTQDSLQKLWDHLYIMSGFQLDVDGPFPKPDASILVKEPMLVPYSTGQVDFRHYGRNLQQIIKNISAESDAEVVFNSAIAVGRMMKMFYLQYNKEMLDDRVVVNDIKRMSGGKIVLDLDKIMAENLLAVAPIQGSNWKPQGQHRDDRFQNNRNNNNRRRGNSGGNDRNRRRR